MSQVGAKLWYCYNLGAVSRPCCRSHCCPPLACHAALLFVTSWVTVELIDFFTGTLVGKKSIKDIMRSPYSQLHVRWMQQVAQSADINTLVRHGSCVKAIAGA